MRETMRALRPVSEPPVAEPERDPVREPRDWREPARELPARELPAHDAAS